jgi:hypothetical protein
MAREHPLWTRNELTLVLDLFMRLGKKRVKQSHLGVIELSRFLGRLGGASRVQRSPDSVARKLGDYTRIQRAYDRGDEARDGRGALARAVWDEFACDQAQLQESVAALHETVALARDHRPDVESLGPQKEPCRTAQSVGSSVADRAFKYFSVFAKVMVVLLGVLFFFPILPFLPTSFVLGPFLWFVLFISAIGVVLSLFGGRGSGDRGSVYMEHSPDDSGDSGM